MYKSIVKNISPELLQVATKSIVRALPHSAHVLDGEILIDVPLKKRLIDLSRHELETNAEAGATSIIWVRRRRRFSSEPWYWEELSACSPLAASLAAIEDHSGRKIRVFFSRSLLGRLDVDITERLGERVQMAIKDVLDSTDSTEKPAPSVDV